jgi:hypothetical protein
MEQSHLSVEYVLEICAEFLPCDPEYENFYARWTKVEFHVMIMYVIGCTNIIAYRKLLNCCQKKESERDLLKNTTDYLIYMDHVVTFFGINLVFVANSVFFKYADMLNLSLHPDP